MFYGFAVGICMRYCNSEEDAVEVANDGYLKIFRQMHTFEPRHSNFELSFKGWMKSIMINTAIDHYRKNKKNSLLRELDESADSEKETAENAIDKMSYKEVISVVQQLSPVYRTVFCLYVIDGFKHEEIARQLNISVGTSKSNLSKAKINIQKMLAEAHANCYERKAV